MAATGTTTTTAEADNLSDRLRYALTRLSNQQKVLLMVALAAIVALLVASSTWLKQADYRVLFPTSPNAMAAPSSPPLNN